MKQIFAIFFQLFPVTKRPKASEQVAGLLLQRSCPAGGAKNSSSLFDDDDDDDDVPNCGVYTVIKNYQYSCGALSLSDCA